MIPQTAFTARNLTFAVEPLTEAHGPIRLIWLHGWRADKETLRQLAESLLPLGESWLVETPGHGQARVPDAASDLSPAAHAQALRAWLATLPPCPTILIGHSMGFRIILHAVHQGVPHLKGVVALSGAGVPKPLYGKAKVRAAFIRQLLKVGHAVRPVAGEAVLNLIRARFESTDAKSCPAALKPLFRAMVRDDASALLPLVGCPSLLLYGAEDTDTPPELGQIMARQMPNARFTLLPGFNHYTLLTQGRHVVAERIYDFLKTL